MSLHKLTAGSGYDYLTRQVAALDATAKGHTGLASYYTERGETPGVWIGRGCGLRWPASSSGPSMAESRSMPESWLGRSRRILDRKHRQWQVMT
jgi:hypothetical protein